MTARVQELVSSPGGCAFMLVMEAEGLSVDDVARPDVAFAVAAAANDATNPWATDDPQQVMAELRQRGQHLGPVAMQLANSPVTAWWWADLDRHAQQELGWPKVDRSPLQVPDAPPSRWERYAHKHATARVTSTRYGDWSCLGHATASGVGDLPPASETSLHEVTVAPGASVVEIHGADDWHRLCRWHPAHRPAAPPLSRDELVPDWSLVARRHAGMHLSFGGWLAALWNTVTSAEGSTTMWTFEGECTMWLHDALERGPAVPFPADLAPGVFTLPVAAQHRGSTLYRPER